MTELTVAVILAAQNLASGPIRQVQGDIEGLGASSSATAGLFGAFTLAASAAAVALGAVTVEAAKFQTTMNQVQQNTGLTATETKKMSAEVLNMSSTFGVATDKIAEGYAHVMNITHDAAAAQGIMNVSLQSSVSTGADVAQVANVLTNAMHEYGLDTSAAGTEAQRLADINANAAHVMGIMHIAAQEANMTLSQFADTTGRAIGIAAGMKIPLEDIAAADASLTKHGFDAAGAGVQVTDMLVHLIKPTKAATDEFASLSKATGVDLVGDLEKLRSGGMTLIQFIDELHLAYTKAGFSEAQFAEETFKLVQAQRGGLGMNALLTTGYADLHKIMADVSDQTRVNTVTEQGWIDTQQTASAQWNILTQSINNAGIELGTHFLPILTPLLAALSAALPQALRGAGDAFNAAAVATQPLRDAIADLWTHAMAEFGELKSAVQLLFHGYFPEALEQATRAIATFGGYLIDHLARWSVSFEMWVLDAIPGLMQHLGDLLGQIGDWISGKGASDIKAKLPVWITAFTDWAKEVYGPLATKLGDMLGQLGGWITGYALPFLWDRLQAWGQAFVDWIGPHIGPLIGELFSLQGTVLNWITQTALPAIMTEVGKWGAAFVQWAVDAAPKAVVELGHLKDNLVTWISARVPELATELGKWARAFVDWVPQAVTDLKVELKKILDGIEAWLSGSGKSGADGEGFTFGTSFVDGFVRGLLALGDKVGKIAQDAAQAFQTGWNSAGQGGAASLPGGATPSTFQSGGTMPPLPTQGQMISSAATPSASATAQALCGPEAYALLMQALGRPVTIDEALQFAATYGWNQTGGMNGFGNFVNMLKGGGVPFSVTDIGSAGAALAGGTSSAAVISTGQHYFEASAFNPDSGQFNVGATGTVIGGSAQMTAAQIAAFGGINGVASIGTGGAGGSAGAMDPTEAIVRAAAAKNNIDPDIAVRVWKGEGSVTGAGPGDHGSSFGPFQLHMGGLAGGGNAVSGAGDSFKAASGLDPRDPANTQAATDWYLGQVSQSGNWDASHGAAAAGVGRLQGIHTGAGTGVGLHDTVPGGQPDAGPAGTYQNAPGGADYVAADAGSASTAADAAGTKAAASISKQWSKLLEDTSDGLGKIQTKEDKQFSQASDKLGPDGTDVQKARTDAADKIADLTTQKDTARRIAAEELVYNRGLQDQATTHARQIEDANVVVNQKLADVALVHTRQLQDDQTVHQNTLALEATQHQRTLQDQQEIVNEQLANVALVHQRSLQDAQVPATQQLAAQATVHSRTLQDAEVVYQAKITQDKEADAFAKNMAKATTDAQRAQIQQTHQDNLATIRDQGAEAAVQLAHQRQLQDAENVYQQGLAAAALVAQRGLQDAEIKYQDDQKAQQVVRTRASADQEAIYQMGLRATEVVYQRGLQDTEVQYQRGLAAAALSRTRSDQDAAQAYARELEDKAIVHKNGLEDAAFALQVERIKKDRDDRIAAIAVEFEARKKAILEEAQAAREAFKTQQDEKANALMQQMADLGAKTDPLVAKMKADWAGVDSQFATATQDINGNQKLIQGVAAETGKSATAAGLDFTQSAQDISKALGITDLDVEKYADKWGLDWDAARDKINSETAAILGLGAAVAGLQDKTVTVTTNYVSNGAAGGLTAGGNQGLDMTSSGSGGGGGGGSSSSGGSGSSGDFSTYAGRQAYRDSHPGAIVDASGAYTPPGHAAGGEMQPGELALVGEKGPELFKAGAGGGMVFPNGTAPSSGAPPIDYDKLAAAIVRALNANGAFSVGVDSVHSALLQKKSRGPLGL